MFSFSLSCFLKICTKWNNSFIPVFDDSKLVAAHFTVPSILLTIRNSVYFQFIKYIRIYWLLLYPCERSLEGYRNHSHSVRMSVQIRFWPVICFCFDIGIPYLDMGVSHETMCHEYSWYQYNIDLWPQGQFYSIFDVFMSYP